MASYHHTLPRTPSASNMVAKILVLYALVGLCLARPDSRYGAPPPPQEPPRYDFNWAVKDDYSGNDFGHQETRDGYDTQGSYFVLLPDGRRQTVTYFVNGDSGYVAEVNYEGEASYPQAQPQQRYQQPPQPAYGRG